MSRLLSSWLPARRSSAARFRPEVQALEDRATPAQLLVAAPGALSILADVGTPGLSTGDTVRVTLGGGQFTDATMGTNAFTTVEAAVQAANTNADAANTIRVTAGTFTLGVPQLDVTKNLSLVGAGSGVTTVQAGVDTTTGAAPTADDAAAILVGRGVALNVSSLALDGGSGAGVDVAVLLKYTDTGTAPVATSVLSDVAIRNVSTTGGTPQTAGVGV